jgi:MinD-like ATPase involved in chromosome partitioning or flagellar assembly
MRASEVRQNAIDASLEEIEKIEAEIAKASNEGKPFVSVEVPHDKSNAIEAYLKDNGFTIESYTGNYEAVKLTISWF